MKFPILILAVFGLACGKSIPTRNLQDDLNDFLALVPVDEVLAIAMDYIANDAEVQELIAYVQGEEFQKIVTTVEALPQFANFVDFLGEHGLDAETYINQLHDLLDWPHWVHPKIYIHKHARRGVGINGFIDDIIAVLPVDDLKALFNEKLETSPDFKAFYDAISSPEFQSIIEALNAMPEYQELLQDLRDKGVEVDKIIEYLRALFGVSRGSGTRNLQDDLNDFLALIPVDQILAVALDYLANDAEVQEVIAYLQSEKFHKIVTTIEALPEFPNFIDFVKVHGVDLTEIINTIHSIIGLGPYPSRLRHGLRGVGVNGLLQDVLALLPLDDLKALFDQKLETSADFLALYEEIRGAEFQSMIATLNAMQEYQDLLQGLRDYGVDVDYYIQIIRELFGLARGSRNLQDDLNDFLALIPVDQILAVALDYLANDAEVQEVIVYLQSEKFHKIVTTIEALPEFPNFIDFVKVHGVDLTEIINTIHSIIGLGPYPSRVRHGLRGVGVNGLLQDVLALLPLDELKALFDQKLETSADFLALYEEIRGAEFQSMIATLNAMQEYQDLLQGLRDYGVDVDYYIQIIRELFGLARGSRNLQDDLNDFLALIPVDQILAVALDYLANDAEVQEVIVYLQSEKFHKIVTTIEALPEFPNFIDFVKVHGLDLTEIINTIHSIIGLGPYPSRLRHGLRGVGVNGLLQDVLALLPLDDLKALFDQKLETSADFLALYEEIRGAEFQSMIATLNGMQEYQDLLQGLRDYGVDVDYYIQIIRELFGLARGSRNLQDDLNDFLALIPVDQILAVAMDYLANDAEVQEVIAYLQSEKFHKIVTSIEALPEFSNFLDFVKVHGFDLAEIINSIHSIIGLGPYPSRVRHGLRGVGVNGLLQDVLALLPLDELKALFDQKLETSADFLALYEEIRGAEFQSMIATLNAMPEYQDLLQGLRDYGVDVDYYIQIIRELFGLARGSRNLQDDLNDFLALIPLDQILAVAMDYLANDAEVQEVIVYLQSEKFHKIVTTIEALPEFSNFIDFVKVHGVDLTEIINTIHSIIGLGPYPSRVRHGLRGVGVNGLLQDVLALLPLDDLKALFDQKLETSADFLALYEEIRGAQFQSMIATLNAMQEYQDLLQGLRDYGVDVDYYIQIIRDLFGL